MNDKKCTVFGCSNKQHEGKFVGDICAPCYEYITTGRVGCTDSFLKYININTLENYLNYIKNIMLPISRDYKIGAIVNSEDLRLCCVSCEHFTIFNNNMWRCKFTHVGEEHEYSYEYGFVFIPLDDRYIKVYYKI